jgi:hypothetical protein
MAYGEPMHDVMAALKERRAKAEGKLSRAVKALENAKKELQDIEAAERVFATITGESPSSPKDGGGSASDRDRTMTRLLGASPEEARTPAELYPIYVGETGDDINLDAFRTALWRLQKKVVPGDSKTWAVRSSGGRYWREAVTDETEDFDYLLLDSEEDS